MGGRGFRVARWIAAFLLMAYAYETFCSGLQVLIGEGAVDLLRGVGTFCFAVLYVVPGEESHV